MNEKKLESVAKKTTQVDKLTSSKLPQAKRRKSRGNIYHESVQKKLAASARKAPTMGNKRFYADLRLKEKKANERMRQLELQGIKSPAYEATQAKLEILGKRTKGDRGRRFSETGKATYNEMQLLDKILDEFLESKTSTLTGAKDYYESVWNTANKNMNLEAAGITRQQWLDFWQAMPQKKKDRLFGSDQIVAIVRAYSIKDKRGQIEDDNKMTVEEIAEAIKASEDLQSAYNAIGISWKEAQRARLKKFRKV